MDHTPGNALREHYPEYFMEASALGMFMVSACSFGVLLEHPSSAVHQALEDPLFRRALMGLAMGLTAILIICSPFGKRSGAHMNPSVTLAYFMLGKVSGWDAMFYVLAQFLGGMAGVLVADTLIGPALADTNINYVETVPGRGGPWVAFGAELAISAVLMFTVLVVSNARSLARWTPVFAGGLVAFYITIESPLSGMSMNPARTFGSALFAMHLRTLWVYFTAPVLGMSIAAGAFRALKGAQGAYCAKLHHFNTQRCIFHCNFGALVSGRTE
jgi:aquaporin Z